MNEILNNIGEAERGGLIDLGKALRRLITSGGGGGATAANVTDFRSGASDKYISPAVFFDSHIAVTLQDGATITPDLSSGINFLIVLGGNRLIANPSGIKVGQEGILLVQQDAAGGHTPVWDTFWRFSGTPTFYDGPHAWTLVRYWVQTSSVIRATVEGGSSSPIPAANVAEIRAGLEALKYISPAALIASEEVVTLVDASTIDIDLGEGINFQVTLGGNRTMGSPLDQMPGRSGEIIVRQDATGGRTLAWHADWKFTAGTPALPSAPNAAVTFRYLVVGIGNVQVTPQPVASSVSDFWQGSSQSLFLSPQVASASLAPVTLADQAVITPNFSDGFIFSVTLGGNRQIANPTNQKRQSGFFYLKQDTTGGRSVSWGSAYKFLGNQVPILPTDPNAWTIVPYWAMATDEIVCGSVDSVGTGSGSSGILAATAAETRTATNATKYVSPFALGGFFAPTVIPDGTTITPNLDNGLTFISTLQGNRQIANITNQKIGFGGYFILIQDATGGRTPTWSSHYTFQGGTPVLNTAPNAWTIIPYIIQDFGVIRVISPQVSPIAPPSSVAEYRAGVVDTKYISPKTATDGNAPVALTDGATITVNLSLGRVFRVTLEGDRALANPTNQIAGQSGLFIFRQDSVGGRTLAFGNQYLPDGDPVVIGSNPNQKTVVPYYVEESGKVHIG